jgi:hypothetical protein
VNAINIGKVRGSRIATIRWYELTCGHRVKHDRDLGALNLAGILTEHLKRCPTTLTAPPPQEHSVSPEPRARSASPSS